MSSVYRARVEHCKKQIAFEWLVFLKEMISESVAQDAFLFKTDLNFTH